MEILVCIKQVPDDSVEIRMNPQSGQPDLSQADLQGNAFDTYAQELAVRYIEANGGSVTVCSVGGEENKTCLKNALAVGAKRAYLILHPEGAADDPASTAEILAAAIPEIEAAAGITFDLVLCGKESTDYIDGETAEYLAERLGYPFTSNIVEINPLESGIAAKKEMDDGYQIVETPLPALMTVSKPDYDPRYPTIKTKLSARKMPIPTIIAEKSTPCVKYLGFREPQKRAAGVKIQEEEAADAVAQAMKIMISRKII